MSSSDEGNGVPVGVGAGTISAPITDPMHEATRNRGPVVALREKGSGFEHVLPRARRVTVGARGGCDLVIDDPCVSGLHCVIERRGAAVFVRDHRSKNGTYVNGHAIEGIELRPGSVLTVGRTSLVAVTEAGLGQASAFEQLRGSDPRFRAAIDTAVKVAATECTVLIVGETGTGKELVARVVHESSLRSAEPFVAINCGAIPHELIGSELFGHERGSFTGAVVERDGCFMQADGGTLLLDELGELPLDQQPHLLRVLETRRVRRIGGVHERAVDVRVIAATNRLEGLGSPSSLIRLDLYHRLATVVIALPPLRERPGDIDEIVHAILDELAPQFGRRRITAVAWDALRSYAWPGNVRELRQAMLRAVTLGGDDLRVEDIFGGLGGPPAAPLRSARAHGTPPGYVSAIASAAELDGLRLGPVEMAQRDLMADALARCRSIRSAAELVGMPKSTFAEKAQRWGLLEPRRSRAAEPRSRPFGSAACDGDGGE